MHNIELHRERFEISNSGKLVYSRLFYFFFISKFVMTIQVSSRAEQRLILNYLLISIKNRKIKWSHIFSFSS
jgi:hypothetical protein